MTKDYIDIETAIMLLNDIKENTKPLSLAHVHALDMAIEALENQVYVSPMVKRYGRD